MQVLDAALPAPASGGFTLRGGGPGPYGEDNLAAHVGDDPARVAAARDRLAALLGAPLVLAEQVHGAGVAVVDAPGELAGVDALVTGRPGLALVVMAADCLPVLLADPGAGVVAAVHAGRAGLAEGVLQAALAAMAGLGASAPRTVAALGPAVCGRCYELPLALADDIGRRVPASRGTTRTGSPAVDLAAGAEALLRRAGLLRVARVGGCTLEQPDLFSSYRRDGVTGRQAGVVQLRP